MIGLRLLKCYSSAPLSLPQSKPRTPHESIVRVGFAKLPNGVFYSLTKLSCNYSFSETSVRADSGLTFRSSSDWTNRYEKCSTDHMQSARFGSSLDSKMHGKGRSGDGMQTGSYSLHTIGLWICSGNFKVGILAMMGWRASQWSVQLRGIISVGNEGRCLDTMPIRQSFKGYIK